MQLFTCRDEFDDPRLAESLAGRFHIESDSPQRYRCTFLDSFDRRILEAGDGSEASAVELERRGKDTSVRWRDAEGRELRATCDAETEPRFAEDLPPGPLREALGKILDLRALLPMLELRGRAQALRFLDDERKTVVRAVRYELEAVDAEERDPVPIGILLELRPLRGYEQELGRVRKQLKKAFGLRTAPPLLELGREALGRRSFGHTSRLGKGLGGATPAEKALRDVLLELVATIRANEPGVRAQLDTEFLHDLRVAVRRTRSALQRFRGVLPEDTTRRFEAEFRWIGELTGPCRDLDVHLLEFDEHAARLDAKARRLLEPLRQLLSEEREHAQERLVTAFESDRWKTLLDQWEQWLERGPRKRERMAEGARPIAEVAAERARELHKRLLTRGRKIDDKTPAQALHDLRKDGKKLRYALELFRDVYPKDSYRSAVRTMKRLQDMLGDFQDFEVQQEALRSFGQRLLEEERGSADTLLVMGRLIDELARRQDAARKRFGECFADFDSQESRALFAELLGAARKKPRKAKAAKQTKAQRKGGER